MSRMKEEQTTLVRRSEPSWFVVRWTLQLAYFIPSHRQGIPPLAAQTIHDVLVLYDHFWNEGQVRFPPNVIFVIFRPAC